MSDLYKALSLALFFFWNGASCHLRRTLEGVRQDAVGAYQGP